MKSSWSSYSVVFLSAIISLWIPAFLALVSKLFSPKRSSRAQFFESPEIRPDPIFFGQRMNVRLFLAANAALVLITLALELVPCVTTLNSENKEGLLKGIFAIVSVASFAILGLLYSVRKGDMGWLGSLGENGKHNLNESSNTQERKDSQ